MSRKSVGIIGAGASGIGVARSLGKAGIDFEIIEATGDVGGNWQPSGPASKMYESAHLISSKQNTQFIDHPMPINFPVYPRHDLFHSYLKGLATASNIPRSIRFNTTVAAMKPDSGGWRLLFQDGSDAAYDVVVLCNGLLGKPISHPLAAQTSIESAQAVSYKSADHLKGKRVLVVGGGNSGCDIAVDAARTQLAHLGLKLNVDQQIASDLIASGTIISQAQPGGSTVDPASTVGVTVSTGPPLVTVPDVGGQSPADAVTALQTAGFTPRIQYIVDATNAGGNVSAQNPAANTTAPRRSEVTISVSVPGTVPDVTNMTLDVAKAAIVASGYTIGNVAVTQDGPSGKVARTEPEANAALRPGEAVTIYYHGVAP